MFLSLTFLTGLALPTRNSAKKAPLVQRENSYQSVVVKPTTFWYPKERVYTVHRPRTTSPPELTQKPKTSPQPRVASTGLYNCVTVLKKAGFLPNERVTKDGYARSIPVKSTKLPPEGQVVVIKTAESWMGHVAAAVVKDGVLTTVVDSLGAGRIIPASVYKGFL